MTEARSLVCVSLISQVLVVGDVHGQYFDLLKILQMWRPDTRLLFLGDYVGEGVPPPFEGVFCLAALRNEHTCHLMIKFTEITIYPHNNESFPFNIRRRFFGGGGCPRVGLKPDPRQKMFYL